MSQKWTSIVTQAILAVCGVFFFVMASNFKDGGTSVYASAGYYPMLVSGLLTLFSITGILSDLFGKGKNNKKVIDISHIKNVGLIVVAVLIIILAWQFLHLFYLGAMVGITLLLIGLNPAPKTRKSVITAIIIAAGMCVSAYVIFEFALKIHV